VIYVERIQKLEGKIWKLLMKIFENLIPNLMHRSPN
jgi:hypothetical protein